MFYIFLIYRQQYAYYQLMALNENGTSVVESFQLPSACTCHHKDLLGINLKTTFNQPRLKLNSPVCDIVPATRIVVSIIYFAYLIDLINEFMYCDTLVKLDLLAFYDLEILNLLLQTR